LVGTKKSKDPKTSPSCFSRIRNCADPWRTFVLHCTLTFNSSWLVQTRLSSKNTVVYSRAVLVVTVDAVVVDAVVVDDVALVAVALVTVIVEVREVKVDEVKVVEVCVTVVAVLTKSVAVESLFL